MTTIPLSKAKAVCTTSEFALLRASRNPKLNPEQSKSLAGRARKALDKWQDLSRGQARAGSTGERTRLKVDLFRDALKRFQAKLAHLPAGASPTGGKRAGKAKRARARGHRKARAAVREDLAGATVAMSARAHRGGSGAIRRPARKVKVKAKRAAAAAAPRRAKKRRPATWSVITSGKHFRASPEKQRAAKARSKRSRIAESGHKTHVRAHVAAQGKRAQARRDRKRSRAGR